MSSPIDYPKALNSEQLDVVLHGDGACLVLAGAGSGKTRTLTYRVAYLIEKGVRPENIVLLTFTNKAAREMVERVDAVLMGRAQGIVGGTFHSIGARWLRQHAEWLGFTRGFTILDSDDAKDLLKAILVDRGIETKEKRFPSKNVLADVISYARNTQRSLEEVIELKCPHFVQHTKEIQEIAELYQQRKKASNAMDFDDLLTFTAGLLEDPVIGERISERAQYVLVDEYQDTNTVQARFVKALSRVHANILAVGDDAQSIYGFRGADVQNILSFPTIWPQTKTFKLLNNYRSTPEILALANASLEHNQEQFQKELIAQSITGPKPVLVSCASASQEARFIADELLKEHHKGTRLSSLAVLFRSSAHSQTLEFELMKRAIPYEYRGGQKFFERAHIKDVLSFLRVIENVRDEIAWLRILGMQPGVGATTASEIARQCLFLPMIEDVLAPGAITVPKRGVEGFQELVTILKTALSHGRLPSGLIRSIIGSNYQLYLEKEYPNYRERLEDLEQLATFAEGYQELAEFLSDIALYDDAVTTQERKLSTQEDRVILSTIHQAKGLEWDTVCVMHLTDQSFPSKRAMEEEEGIEEERRLFYVAVTRARRQLFLTYPMTVGYDTLSFCQPSMFVEEVSPKLFEKRELTESRFGAGPRSHKRFSDDGWLDDDVQDVHDQVIELDSFGYRKKEQPSPSLTLWKKKK